MKNGQFLKGVNAINEIENSEFANKMQQKKKESSEISQILYLNEEKLLISACFDSTIKIYDEYEPEESVLLKVLSGCHDAEIHSLAYTAYFQFMATGASDGTIGLWDFETGKLEHLFNWNRKLQEGETKSKTESNEILALEFVEPYPLLVSGSASG